MGKNGTKFRTVVFRDKKKPWGIYITYSPSALSQRGSSLLICMGISGYYFILFFFIIITVDSCYLDFGYLEKALISKRKSDPCFNIEI